MNASDKDKIEKILQVIASDEELIKQFAFALGEETEDFGSWIDSVKIT